MSTSNNNPLQGLTFSQQAAQQYQQAQNSAQGLNLAQLAAQAHNQFNSAYNQYAQQSQAAQMANLGRTNHAIWAAHRYQIDGQYMTLQQFVDYIWPEDCADKTFFVLKHTKETKDD
jgi:hypothetical protein